MNRIEYYDRLMAVRKKGDWEGWIKFFLKGVAVVSDEATDSAKEIITLKERYTTIWGEYNNSNYSRLLNALFENSFVSKNKVAELLGVSYPTASAVVDEFVSLGILRDITPGQQRSKRYCFGEYVDILSRGTEI